MLKGARYRIGICQKYTPNIVAVVAGLARHKFFGSGLLTGFYDRAKFVYRSSDIGALDEVLNIREYEFLRGTIAGRPDPVILDAGHHIGTFSLWATTVNPKARVLGVEADPDTFEVAQLNAKLAQDRGVNWNVVRRAAWENDDTLSFSTEGQTMGHKVAPDGTVKVQGISLRALLESVGNRADLVKIDVEGAEERFLTPAEPLLKNVDNLVVEIHPKSCSEANVMAILRRNFANVKTIGGRQSSKPLVWCTQ
jgi:FkbM family methyltransferase